MTGSNYIRIGLAALFVAALLFLLAACIADIHDADAQSIRADDGWHESCHMLNGSRVYCEFKMPSGVLCVTYLWEGYGLKCDFSGAE